MRRKPITRVNNYAMSNNFEDKNILLAVLLKRVCTFEEAMDYLLSAIPEIKKDDMLGELAHWDNNPSEMRRIRSDWQRAKSEGRQFGWLTEDAIADRAKQMKQYRSHGSSLRAIAEEFNVSIETVKRVCR